MVPWLSKFGQLTWSQQTSLAGNGQSLPVFGTIIALGVFGAVLVEGDHAGEGRFH